MPKTSLTTIGIIALTATILGIAPAAAATPSSAVLDVKAAAEQRVPSEDRNANGARNGRQKPADTTAGKIFTPPVTAPQATVDTYND
ncbi:hypothetical protein L2K20_07955 [Mycobacterium sp. MBM]|nr:hypothetical protein [Mycobacterium sp. MBM]